VALYLFELAMLAFPVNFLVDSARQAASSLNDEVHTHEFFILFPPFFFFGKRTNIFENNGVLGPTNQVRGQYIAKCGSRNEILDSGSISGMHL
jgi:hypothetical protein